MKCPKCEWENPEGATQCANCQTDLQQPTPLQPTQMEQTPQPPPDQPYGQPPQYGQQPYAAVPNYLAWSIVMTVVSVLSVCFSCCSLVAVGFGITAIVKSSQANNKKSMGDFAGAMRDAESAKMWLFWSLGVWAVSVVIGVILKIVYGPKVDEILRQMQHNMPR